jgi:spore coat assembly protein
MTELKVGDIVGRKSYGCDVFFKVVDIREENGVRIVTLKGISYRIEADAPEADLELQPEQKVSEYRSKCMQMAERKEQKRKVNYGPRFGMYQKKVHYRDTPKEETGIMKRPGKILHIDGDPDYLDTCLNEYRKLGVNITGKYIPEKDQAAAVLQLLDDYRPDILVLTGHDGLVKGNENYSDIKAYRSSQYYIDAVKQARKYNNDLDSLVIFAGACQSMYSELLKAGANFASSPRRALIHALDPVRVCQKIAFAGIDKVVQPEEVIDNTITGREGIGGVQTRGKYREGNPVDHYGYGYI